MAAAGVVGDHPVELARQQRLPEKFHVFARADRRVHLGQLGGGRGDVQHQVADGHFAAEIDVGKHLGHHQRGLHRLARRQVQQVDVGQRRLVGQVAGDEHRQAFGMRWPRGVVRSQAFERFVFQGDLAVGRHDLGGLAVQRQRNLRGALWHLLARGLDRPHRELEVRVVVTLVLGYHQELLLAVAGAMQTVRAVEHEDLEAGHAELLDQQRDFFEVGFVHRRKVETVVHMEPALGQLEHFGIELLVGPALVQIVLAGAKVVQAGGDPAHGRGLALADRVFGQWRVDAAVHMGVDNAGKRQPAPAVVHLPGQRDIDGRRDFRNPSAADGDIGFMHRVAVRPNHTDVFDQQVVLRLGHEELLEKRRC